MLRSLSNVECEENTGSGPVLVWIIGAAAEEAGKYVIVETYNALVNGYNNPGSSYNTLSASCGSGGSNYAAVCTSTSPSSSPASSSGFGELGSGTYGYNVPAAGGSCYDPTYGGHAGTQVTGEYI